MKPCMTLCFTHRGDRCPGMRGYHRRRPFAWPLVAVLGAMLIMGCGRTPGPSVALPLNDSAYRGTLGNTGHYAGPGPSLAAGGTRLWRYSSLDFDIHPPMVSQDHVFFATSSPSAPGQIHALDPTTGRLAFTLDYPVATALVPMAIGAGSLYLGAGSDVVALDVRTAQPAWSTTVGRVVSVLPTVQTLYVGIGYLPLPIREDNNTGMGHGALVALDRQTGRERWRVPLADSAVGPLAIAEGMGYIRSQRDVFSGDTVESYETLHAIDLATGQEKWQFTGSPIDSQLNAPTVVGGVVYIIAVTHSHEVSALYALDMHTGHPVWSRPFTQRASNGSVVVAHDVVYVASIHWLNGVRHSSIDALDARTGEERWSWPVDDYVTGMSLAGDHLYAIVGPPSIEEETGMVVELDARTGMEQGRRLLDYAPSGAPIIVNGVLYVVGEGWRQEPPMTILEAIK